MFLESNFYRWRNPQRRSKCRRTLEKLPLRDGAWLQHTVWRAMRTTTTKIIDDHTLNKAALKATLAALKIPSSKIYLLKLVRLLRLFVGLAKQPRQ